MDTETLDDVIGWAEVTETDHPPENPLPPFEEVLAAHAKAKESAIARFKKLGFTPAEIQAITN